MKLKWRYSLTILFITALCVTMVTIAILSSSSIQFPAYAFKHTSLAEVADPEHIGRNPRRRHGETDEGRGINLTTNDISDPCNNELDLAPCQKERHDVLRSACSALDFESPQRARNLTSRQLAGLRFTYAIDNHRLLYCYVPKVSCTNWKRLFLVSNGVFLSVDDIKNAHVEADFAFRKLSQLPVGAANDKLKTHASFLFVRNPFSRLLSAYREKIEWRDPAKCFFSQFITRWLRRTDRAYLARRNASTTAKGYTFPEFVRYVIARRADNEHWNDQHRLCSPCLVEYDFIGKYETLHRDADGFLRTFAKGDNGSSAMKFPAPQKRPTHSSTDEMMARYYGQIPGRDLEALVECLYTDMRLFGYAIPKAVQRPGLRLSAKYTQLVDVG